jgi:energy-coupling factor transport system ATP-binding protein
VSDGDVGDTAEQRLELVGAGVRYAGRSTPALEGIDLVVTVGERVGVTGRSGSGTSTLALLAGGFIPRVVRATASGQTIIDGLALAATTGAADLLGRVGIVFATPANQLSGSKPTVREELAFGLENLGVPRDEMDARMDTVLDRLGIAHLAGREPLALSGGEQQRVAIASIVTMGPRLLVLDQPTAQLDPAGTAEVAALLGELARGGTAILCVEHDPEVLRTMDRVAVLDGGRLVGIDVPAVALGPAIAGQVGLAPPALVELATRAGLDPSAAFDVDAIAAALATMPTAVAGAILPAPLPAPSSPSLGWAPAPGRAGPAHELDDLSFRYPDGSEAVRGVSLRIEPGESVAIVGQNGSGKTTLAKHLDGLLRPTAGSVRLDGRPTADVPVDRLAATVGFAFQDPGDQLFERTVEREIAFGPRNLGFDAGRIAALVSDSLAAVGLDAQRATNPYDLGLARRKLVALASVLAMDPAILVLDEPTTGQDPDGVERLVGVVRAWRSTGRTLLTITHDMAFAAAFERVVVMRDGAVIDDGPPGRVLAAANASLLASSGLTPPPVARVAAALGLASAPADVGSLLAVLRARG